jgi:F-type H+-transporting ATPase subunit epsilon
MNSLKIKFKIASPERLVLETEVDSLTLPTSMGQITVLPNHVPLVAVLSPGEIKYISNNIEEYFVVSSGVIEIKNNNEVMVLAESADFVHEINLEQAEEAKERAKKIMQEQYKDEKLTADAVAVLEKNLARIRFAHKHRTRTKKNLESGTIPNS